MFELEGDEDLDHLPLHAALGGEEEAARQLHGERGAAFDVAAAGRHVVAQRAEQAEVVDAAVLEEAAVLDGDHGVHQIRGHLLVCDEAALGAVGVLAEAGDEQRLEFVAGERLALVVGDGLHNAATDVDGGAVL